MTTDWRRLPGGILIITPPRFMRFDFARHIARGDSHMITHAETARLARLWLWYPERRTGQ